MRNGLLNANLIGEELNNELPETLKYSKSYYTRKMKSMGLKTTRKGGKTYIIWDDDVCNKLAQRYDIISAQSEQNAQHIEKTKESQSRKKSRRCIKTICLSTKLQ